MSASAGAASPALTKFQAGLAAAASAAGGLVYGPLLVQTAIVAVLLAVVVVFGLAHAHDMTVGRAGALYGGRAVLALAKAAAIALVEWPLRAGHRAAARFDVPLRLQLAAVRSGYRLRDRRPAAAAAAVQVRALRSPLVSRRPTAAIEAVVEAEDGAPIFVRHGA